MLDKAPTQIEIQFANQIGIVIQQLVCSNLTQEDADQFMQVIKPFLKYLELTHYLFDALYDRIVNETKGPHLLDPIRLASFRIVLQIALRLGDDDLTNALETFFLKDKKINQFLMLLEEKKRLGMDTKGTEKRFASAISTYIEIDMEIISRFLDTIGQDKKYLLHLLMDRKLAVHVGLYKFLGAVVADKTANLGDLVPIITQEFDGYMYSYMHTIRHIISATPEFTGQLLIGKKWDVRKKFSLFILTHYKENMDLIKNYCQYLLDNDKKGLEDFDNDFINLAAASAQNLVDYARSVPSSNKRKILRRLVALKSEDDRNEAYLISFIAAFPQYEALLPML